MATINEPANIDNNTANSGAGIETRLETLWQNDQAMNSELGTKADASDLDARTKIQTGSGHAPAGTPVKMSWYEGTTNAFGFAFVNTGLTGILSIQAFVFNSSSSFWRAYGQTDVVDCRLEYDDTGVIRVTVANINTQPVRFLVFHK